ncbi:hypothetical protein NMY22_g12720 [Coprinellus aureogranulatus]|nr:hypothetical protein NMY22_g12720 [Coprinellus aureogranulatus]
MLTGDTTTNTAARHLTPVTLELGGKSPVFIDPNCDLSLTSKRLLWGKILNAGQTCLAPDYVLVPRGFQDELVEALKERSAGGGEVEGVFGGDEGGGGAWGEVDEDERYVSPTIVKDVAFDDVLMQEEIFGPILPIVPVDSVEEALRYVNEHDHPLAIYAFSQDPEYKKKILENTQSGAVVFNEQIIHPAAEGLPFGGVGASGSGYHTGKYGFDIFTHLRASIDSPGLYVSFFLLSSLLPIPPSISLPPPSSLHLTYRAHLFILSALTYRAHLFILSMLTICHCAAVHTRYLDSVHLLLANVWGQYMVMRIRDLKEELEAVLQEPLKSTFFILSRNSFGSGSSGSRIYRMFGKQGAAYYGKKGFVILVETLREMFPQGVTSTEKLKLLNGSAVIEEVLLPEAAIMLIQQDKPDISSEQALQIHHESCVFGAVQHAIDD